MTTTPPAAHALSSTTPTLLQGADVAKYQQDAQHHYITPGPNVASFIIAKATQGTSEVDPGYSTHAAHALSAGQHLAAYHFASTESLDAQARFFVAHATGAKALMVDNDQMKNGPTLNRTQTRTLINAVRQHDPLHRKILLYMSLGAPFFYACGQDFDCVAAYGIVPSKFHIHQYSDGPGYDHDVALNVATLNAIFGVTPPPTSHTVHIAHNATVVVETLGVGGCIATVNGHYGVPTHWTRPNSKAACDPPVHRKTCDGKSGATTVRVRSGGFANHHIRLNPPTVFVTTP